MTSPTPENELERLLVQASTDIGARPAFYHAFLDSILLVPCNARNTPADDSSQNVVNLEDVQSVIQMRDSEGNLVIPVFSSFPRLQETHIGRVVCLQITGKILLDLLGTEKTIVLNPVSEHSKEFPPQELVALQDGSMFKQPEHQTYPPDAEVQPGLPPGYLEALVDALKSLFARYPGITRAYLASLQSPGAGVALHPVVGMDLTDNWFDIVRDAGLVAREILGEGQYVDFLPLRQGDAVSDYMLSTITPFYLSG